MKGLGSLAPHTMNHIWNGVQEAPHSVGLLAMSKCSSRDHHTSRLGMREAFLMCFEGGVAI